VKILFVHQNFPGQFKHLAPALASRGHEVVALSMRASTTPIWRGVRVVPYRPARGTSATVHPWVADLETKVIRGQACLEAALQLKQQGFTPDTIVVHPGWGEGLFLRDVWPNARIGLYCEFFYGVKDADVAFDPEFPSGDPHDQSRVRMKNANNLLHMQVADGGLSPTAWQAGTFPEPFRSRIAIAHDGIDTRHIAPRADVALTLSNASGSVVLDRSDEVITFVSRNLEPYRGYHMFMRALPRLLAERPKARVVIVGGAGVSYGTKPAGGRSWRQVLSDEIRPALRAEDWARVHHVGQIEHGQFIALLQLSTVHVYLTYPFVLSWSLLEAMSAGCAIVASDTAPVREVIAHGATGRLAGFFDRETLVREICDLLDDPPVRQQLGAAARHHVVTHYDLSQVCLPRQVQWVESLTGAQERAGRGRLAA
jgi:glycosyltransferase involved in cell wall biosynthesis